MVLRFLLAIFLWKSRPEALIGWSKIEVLSSSTKINLLHVYSLCFFKFCTICSRYVQTEIVKRIQRTEGQIDVRRTLFSKISNLFKTKKVFLMNINCYWISNGMQNHLKKDNSLIEQNNNNTQFSQHIHTKQFYLCIHCLLKIRQRSLFSTQTKQSLAL